MPNVAGGTAEPPIENRPSSTPYETPSLPDSDQKGYVEVSTFVPPPSTGPFAPPPPLTDTAPAPADTSTEQGN
jgi:hypothetical protein